MKIIKLILHQTVCVVKKYLLVAQVNAGVAFFTNVKTLDKNIDTHRNNFLNRPGGQERK